ncbi:hypothetical protein B566_EDAN010115 [Ephemera danica]|nr:hypothetical protein B566_EDAN010115 [Ephemera danica]
MVFTTALQLARNRGPCEYWRKRRIFRLTAHFTGRKRNCYSIAVRYAHRALAYATKDRALKKENMVQLWDTRLTGACQEHGFSYSLMRESLSRMNILLNRKALTDLSIWEPRTFKSMISMAWVKAAQEDLKDVKKLGPTPQNVHIPQD